MHDESDSADHSTRQAGLRSATLAGVVAAFTHICLLALTVTQTLRADDAHWPQYWIKFLALDFPLSIGVMPVAWLFPAPDTPLHNLPNFWWPVFYHGIVGTLWWYVLGNFIAYRLRNIR